MGFAVEIAISNPLPVYTCGDTITGAVYVRSDDPVLVNDLLVQLLCKVVTRSKGKESWPGVSRLGDQQTVSIPYCFVKRIITEPRWVSSQQPLEFEFTVPSETMRNQIEPRWSSSDTFEQFDGHAIPPTWKDRFGRARVSHGLEVVMHAGGIFEGKKTIAGREIHFSPCRAVEFPDAKCISTSRLLHPKLPKSALYKGEAVKRRRSIVQMLSPEEKCQREVQIDVQCPTVLCSGGPLPISISAQTEQFARCHRQLTPPDDSPSFAPINSGLEVLVDGIYIYLAVRTNRRIKTDTDEHNLFDDDQIPVCNIIDRPVALSHLPIPLNIHYPEMRLRHDAAPSFKSFSLRKRFEIRVRIRLTIGDQQHNVDISSPILILPGVFRNTAGAVRDMGDRTSLRRRISEETLPAYAEIDPLSGGPNPMIWERPPPLMI